MQHALSMTDKVEGCAKPRQLNFDQWHLMFLIPLYGTCFLSPTWLTDFWGGCCVFEKCRHCWNAHSELFHASWQIYGEVMNWDVLGLPSQLVFQNLSNKIHGSCLLFISLFIADLCMVKNVYVYILCSKPLCLPFVWYMVFCIWMRGCLRMECGSS